MSSHTSEYRLAEEIDTVLCDIEGTTTSISFVKDVLFPLARSQLSAYLHANFDKDECQHVIELLAEQSVVDRRTDESAPLVVSSKASAAAVDKEHVIESVISNVVWQMDADRKATALKQLQGCIWRDAYEKGVVKGHVYDDVVPMFERLASKAIKLYIYSSGSIEAQKLLYKYSLKGDLLPFISGHFDTTSGLKVNMTSYQNILGALNKRPEQVLFLTDIVRECDAASQAGVSVCLVRREDNADKQVDDYKWITKFDQLII